MKTFLMTSLLALLALPALAPSAAAEPILSLAPDGRETDVAFESGLLALQADAGPGGVSASGSAPRTLPPGIYIGVCENGRFALYDIIGVQWMGGYCLGGDWSFKTIVW